VHFETTVAVDAPVDAVWRVVVDVVHWPELTDSMRRVEWVRGDSIALGNAARVTQPWMPPNVWTVTAVATGESFSWQSGSPGVRTVATHVVRPGDPGRSTLTVGLEQFGPLAPLVGLVMGSRIRRFVRMEAAGLKQRAERA